VIRGQLRAAGELVCYDKVMDPFVLAVSVWDVVSAGTSLVHSINSPCLIVEL
jgi:hypothetical protein